MRRERISDNVYWFQSEDYAQVTAGVITGPQWAIVVDTLAYPDEAKAIREFVTEELGLPVRYLINTHSHSDHAWGNCFFPGATIIAHTKCAENLKTNGFQALEETKKTNSEFADSKIIIPHLTFDIGELTLKVGKKNIIVMLTPGHSDDGISVFVEEDRILFAGDSFLAVPQFSGGSHDNSVETIQKIAALGLENIIQGHGDIVLRGEIDTAVEENLAYLEKIKQIGEDALRFRNPAIYLNQFDIESCGKSRVLISGLATSIHTGNLIAAYKKALTEIGRPENEDELINNDTDDDDFGDFFSSEESTYNPDRDSSDDPDPDFEYMDNYDKLDDF